MSGNNGFHLVPNEETPEERVSQDALDWAIEGGLKTPLRSEVKQDAFGFTVLVEETRGKERCAHLRYTKEGKRLMYERAK